MKTVKTLALITITAVLSGCGKFEWFPDYIDDVPPTVTGTINNISFSNNTTIYPSIPSNVTLSATDISEPVTIFYTTNGTDATSTYAAPLTISDKSWSLTVYGKDAVGNKSTPYTVKFTK